MDSARFKGYLKSFLFLLWIVALVGGILAGVWAAGDQQPVADESFESSTDIDGAVQPEADSPPQQNPCDIHLEQTSLLFPTFVTIEPPQKDSFKTAVDLWSSIHPITGPPRSFADSIGKVGNKNQKAKELPNGKDDSIGWNLFPHRVQHNQRRFGLPA